MERNLRKGCESSIHDHDIDFGVTMVGWLDIPDSDRVTSEVGMPSTYLVDFVFLSSFVVTMIC